VFLKFDKIGKVPIHSLRRPTVSYLKNFREDSPRSKRRKSMPKGLGFPNKL